MIRRYLLLSAIAIAPLCSYSQSLELPIDFDEGPESRTGPTTADHAPPPIGDVDYGVRFKVFPNSANKSVVVELESSTGRMLPISIRINKSDRYTEPVVNISDSFSGMAGFEKKIDLSKYGSGSYYISIIAGNRRSKWFLIKI